MKVTGKIKDIMLDIETRKPIVTIEINEKQDFLCNADELMKSDRIDIEMKRYRKKRSLKSNGYAWALIDRLAEELSISKERIYRNIVRNIGGNSTFVRVENKARDKLVKEWSKNGIGWFADIIDEDEIYSDIALYYGSSTYDTKQMARFIELITQECQELGIPYESLERQAYLEGLLNS